MSGIQALNKEKEIGSHLIINQQPLFSAPSHWSELGSIPILQIKKLLHPDILDYSL